MNHYFKGFSISIGAHFVIVLLFAIAKFSGYWLTDTDKTVDVSSVDFVSQGGHGGQSSGENGNKHQEASPESKARQTSRDVAVADTLSTEKLTSVKRAEAVTSALFHKGRTIISAERASIPFSAQHDGAGTSASSSLGNGRGLGNGQGSGHGGNGFGNGSGEGQGTGDGALIRGYISHNYNYMLRHIKKWLVYPEKARRLGVTGTTKCSFVIAADGNVSNLRVTKSSGDNALDEAAMQAIRRASPFPKPPVPATIVVPIAFSLK